MPVRWIFQTYKIYLFIVFVHMRTQLMSQPPPTFEVKSANIYLNPRVGTSVDRIVHQNGICNYWCPLLAGCYKVNAVVTPVTSSLSSSRWSGGIIMQVFCFVSNNFQCIPTIVELKLEPGMKGCELNIMAITVSDGSQRFGKHWFKDDGYYLCSDQKSIQMRCHRTA